MSEPLLLMILDGWGERKECSDNSITLAHPENFCQLEQNYPHTLLKCSGKDVGLPDGLMGNSEVGHLNIGSGRIVYQEISRIFKAIEDQSFFSNPEFLKAIEYAQAHQGSVHLMGLLSDGGVHSHIEHLYALVELAKRRGLPQIYIHAFMDGRDVPPASGKATLGTLDSKLRQLEFGKVATVSGRYYAMDRDKRWDRVQKAYNALVLGEGEWADNSVEAMDQSYNAKETDEFVRPTVIKENGKPVATIDKDDAVIFFNFRPDRARELTRSFIEPGFRDFERKKGYFPVHFVSMTQYDETFQNLTVAYEPQALANTFGQYISEKGKTQLRIAETEKYAHVTFFFNGGVEVPNPGEDRALIPSPKVPTYDQQPSMSAPEVTEEAIKRIESGKYDVMILNFANCDMVGHTGDLQAAIEAVETVDTCLGKVVTAIRRSGGTALITADHGNAEQMVDYATGAPHTAHTTNPVPFILVDDRRKDAVLRENGRLSDIAPTMLQLMKLEKPKEMSGESLLK